MIIRNRAALALAFTAALLAGTAGYAPKASGATDNVAEEVAWVVGDQPIWKSDIEEMYQQMLYERVPITGDPYCIIPEQLAIEKLYLHQADADTVEVQPSMVAARVDAQINHYINALGSREKVEQTLGRSINDFREQLTEMVTNRNRIEQVQQSLTKNVKATPADVRRFYSSLPADSVPWVAQQVEVQILTLQPTIPRQDIEDIKDRLRSFADRVNKGEAEFSTLAILYSEDGSASRGGEIGFMGKGMLEPEYAAAAFNLNDPNKVSKVIETQYGFHIIQLIEKRGDRINTRHILLRPRVPDKDLLEAVDRLDSLRSEILDSERYTFEEAVALVSNDKDTRANRGVMVNQQTGSTRFEMSDLPQEVAKAVNGLEPGQISRAFIMKDPKSSRDIVAIVKLTNRIDAHRANIGDDYQLLKNMLEQQQGQQILDKWLEKKMAETYIRIEEKWRNCEFSHKGWIKQ